MYTEELLFNQKGNARRSQTTGIRTTREKGIIKRESHQCVLPSATLQRSQRKMSEIYHSWTAEAHACELSLIWKPTLSVFPPGFASFPQKSVAQKRAGGREREINPTFSCAHHRAGCAQAALSHHKELKEYQDISCHLITLSSGYWERCEWRDKKHRRWSSSRSICFIYTWLGLLAEIIRLKPPGKAALTGFFLSNRSI